MLGILIMSACSNSSPDETKKENNKESNAISQCLADKDYKYEELLTKSDIAKYVHIDESSYKKEISKTEGKYGSCTYSWESSRPHTESVIAGHKVKMQDNNKVTVKMLDFYTDKDLEKNEKESAIDLFDISYKKLSQVEYEEMMANIKEKIGDKPKDLAQVEKMMDSRMKFKYELIDNLGDRAYWKWNNFGIELIVLVGNARFTIESKTTGEAETSLEHAVHFAKEVLAKCK